MEHGLSNARRKWEIRTINPSEKANRRRNSVSPPRSFRPKGQSKWPPDNVDQEKHPSTQDARSWGSLRPRDFFIVMKPVAIPTYKGSLDVGDLGTKAESFFFSSCAKTKTFAFDSYRSEPQVIPRPGLSTRDCFVRQAGCCGGGKPPSYKEKKSELLGFLRLPGKTLGCLPTRACAPEV